MAFKLPFKNSISFPQERKQRTLLIVFIAIIIAAFIILYFGFWNFSSSSGSISTESDSLLTSKNISSIERVIKSIDFNISFLKKSSFRDLKIYSDWPLEIDLKGNKNPFSSN